MEKAKVKKMLEYKGKPLVRCGNTIYLGDMSDPYVAMLQILSTEDYKGLSMANRVAVQLISTDVELRPKDRIIKKSEKSTLYDAINIASIWLERALAPHPQQKPEV